MIDKRILIRYGEIALKGNNRYVFISRLVKNIKLALADYHRVIISKEHGRIFVDCKSEDYALVENALKKIFGIVSLSPADVVTADLEAIKVAAIVQMQTCVNERGPLTFKVETRRPNKNFKILSPEVSQKVGAAVLKAVKGLKVNVKNPQVTCNIEIRDKAYVFTSVVPCLGGMPYKSAGKAVLLLSGGIDSPVAGYAMAKRGLEIEAVHFHSYPYTSERAFEKVLDLAKKLSIYTGKIRIHSVNLLNIQKAIGEYCPSDEMTILSRRFMMTIATQIAEERKCKALVTGENLGQVASQTIEGINVTTDATHLPIFRPLIALDKLDIIKMAQKIDTYETSILPFEDCCTVFLPKNVVTKPRVVNIVKSEQLLDKSKLITEAIATKKVVDVRNKIEISL